MKPLLITLSLFLLLTARGYGSVLPQEKPPTLTGRWLFEFTLRNQAYRLQFDAQASGEGSFRLLDNRASEGATEASWRPGGQSPAIYLFIINGVIELPSGSTGREVGSIEFTASADLMVPIKSLRGQGQYHPPRDPNDTSGREDPFFDFTATRVDDFTVQLLFPNAGERLRRGKEANIAWTVEHATAIAAQQILLSTDNGQSYSLIAPLGAEARNFVWAIPIDFPKIKRARVKIVVTDAQGAIAETVSERTFLIK